MDTMMCTFSHKVIIVNILQDREVVLGLSIFLETYANFYPYAGRIGLERYMVKNIASGARKTKQGAQHNIGIYSIV